MTQIIITAEIARLAAGFQSKEETRYYLNGVHVEPHPVKGVFVVATDGHVMGVFHDEAGSIEGAASAILALPAAVLKECKSKARDPQTRYLVVDQVEGFAARLRVVAASPKGDGDTLEFGETHISVNESGALINGSFPYWRRVLPGDPEPDAPTPHFNPAKLAPFTAVAVSGGASGAIRMTAVNSDFAPIAITVAGAPHFFGVLMSLRDRGLGATKPDWLTATSPVAAAA